MPIINGKKILISGGGRCNFTNINVGPENFESQNKHFSKSALTKVFLIKSCFKSTE